MGRFFLLFAAQDVPYGTGGVRILKQDAQNEKCTRGAQMVPVERILEANMLSAVEVVFEG